jgi:riboflavin transporter FmnP
LSGTALLGAVVAVLDWTFKIAGLKLPFPPLPYLRFDFLGIPMLLAYFLFGFPAGTITSLVAFLSISLRDPTFFKGFMKFLAEFATIVGVYVVLRARKPSSDRSKHLAMISGIIVRVVSMAIAVVLLLPIVGYYPSHMAVVVLLPLFSLFNIIQGFISVFGGFLLYETVIRRLPSLK